MGTRINIPHDAIVFVGDGRKALFLRNAGDEKFPNLTTEQVFVEDNPATHEQGSERPGRLFAGAAGKDRRSALEPTDWHEIEEHRFARKVAETFEKLVRERKVKAAIIAAPPRTLADLRQVLHDDVKARVVAEVDKDFTNHPLSEIERHLTGPTPRG
ncbi:MAG: host attachment protein [Alphaproteobacteria bacterium]|nr:host attachment protein [Alphaproteobacteria bacterium]